jgi:hypothetical protein
MAFAGGLIWAVRVVAGSVLGSEAMGFGDVTLMGMIGAYVGWQGSLIIFFLAPFAGLVIALPLWLARRRKDIAYGPFLCLATVMLLVAWPEIWERWGVPVFWMGWLIPALVGVCLSLMALMLGTWRSVSGWLAAPESGDDVPRP